MTAREAAPGQAPDEAREVLTRKVLAVAGEHAVDVMILADTYAAAAISEAVTAAAAAQPAPGREREALEDIARAIQGSTDTGLPLDRDWLVSRAVYGLGQLPADAPEVLSPHYHTNDIQCRDCQLEKALEENAELATAIEQYRQALQDIARNDGHDLARDHNANIAKQALETP